MLTATQIGGFVGAGLAGAAYVPQISHLVRARCSAGISRLAFGVWLLSSLLITARAVAIGAGVFIVLGAIQIVATALIVVCAARYKDTPCPSPSPSPARGQDSHGDGHLRKRAWFLASGRPPGCRISHTRRARWGAARVRPRPAPAFPCGHRISSDAPEGDDMTASAGVAAAADEGLAAAVGGEAAGAQAAIVIVGRDPGAREILHRELSKRYGGTIRSWSAAGPAELAPWMRDLRAAGLPVALVIGGVGAQDPRWHRGAGRGPRHRPDGTSGGRGRLG